ncbi:nucleotide-binding protein [Bradyrhizobium diazoefficiens]|nr:TIR domain-containing protein [Bradyrhizobium diazoefficiens]MBR0925725.1 nucleotide-binding protein [Bradyrhizobium diazoefficiens]
MSPFEELFEIAKNLQSAAEVGDSETVSGPLKSLDDAARDIGKSFSGSWLGYHSRVYYSKFEPPPAGANFSQEWGLKDLSFTSLGSGGDWREYRFDDVIEAIKARAGNPELAPAKKAAGEINELANAAKSTIESIIEHELSVQSDAFLSKLKEQLERLTPTSKWDVAEHWRPKGQIMTRDTIVLGQGTQVPPHLDVRAEVASIKSAFALCRELLDLARKAASHLERRTKRRVVSERIGTNVFIGHGRSGAWRELKDFIQDRLSLPWDEFNRVPVAGVTNIARLSEMLDAAAVALLVLTGEDEMADGAVQARMNVVHEAGLFQGRLGFTKAILLLEDGCSEFSNVQGLGQIRFPKGKISAAFEEIRRVMEREGLIETS